MDREDADATEKLDEDRVSNVVRLPVDWLGPREELVPFGAAAGEREAAAAGTLAAEEPTADGTPVRAAADFWGEGAAALHDALEAPAERDAGPHRRVPPSSDAHARPRRRDTKANRPPERRLSSGSLRVDQRGGAGRVGGRRRWGVAITAILIAAVSPTWLGPGASQRARTGASAARHTPDANAPFGAEIAALPPVLGSARNRARARRAASRGVEVARHLGARRAARSRSDRARAAQTPAPSHSSAISLSVATQYTTPSDSSPPPAPSQATSRAVSPGSSSSPAGPVGRGAPFEPGQLG